MPASPHGDVLHELGGVVRAHGDDALATRLESLRTGVRDDLAEVESILRCMGDGETAAHASARHLLACEGKRLRPLCVALGSRIGTGFDGRARKLAAAVELVHNATLLHDDVVDLGETRRGKPAARVIHGNAASIFGGDLLLVDALGLLREAGVPGTLDEMLSVIREMVVAEALQLSRRGRIDVDVGAYFRIIEGKTAALFRWALGAGARAGGCAPAVVEALERAGTHLGTTFQIVDDLLDLAGEPAATGKALLADLREGKMTYPLLLALERDPSMVDDVQALCADFDAALGTACVAGIYEGLRRTRALEGALHKAREHVEIAEAHLRSLPDGPAREALRATLWATLERTR